MAKNANAIQGKFLSIGDAAAYIGVSVATMYNYNKSARIPYSRPSGCKCFYKVEDLDAFLESNRVESVLDRVNKFNAKKRN